MGLILDKLEKLLIEHGSAAVRGDIIALLREQARIADKKIAELEIENTSLKTKFGSVNEDLDLAKAENKRLANEIDSLRNQPANERLEKTLAILSSYRNALTKHSLDLADADEYHALLENAERELSCNLTQFRIPDSAIKTREIPQSFSVDMFGKTSGDPYRYEKYIPSFYFQRQIDALLSFLHSRSGKPAPNSFRQSV
jgi:hypothetical protein